MGTLEVYDILAAPKRDTEFLEAPGGGSTYLTASKFNLATYKQTHEEERGGKLKAGWTLMSFPWYKETVLKIQIGVRLCVCGQS